MITPTENTARVHELMFKVGSALEKCEGYELSEAAARKLCSTCGSPDHRTPDCQHTTWSQGMATNLDAGEVVYEKKACELYGLTTAILTVGEFDRGSYHKKIAEQLYCMHRE